jgi:catechol 2,3-dioxygenase-like lactoylglutathione lyase family enzyme
MGDQRPSVWVGHVTVPVTDLARSTAFWTGLGMRAVEQNPAVTVLELRGGTHLVLHPAEVAPIPGSEVGFDLMVEDLVATHAAWTTAGLAPSAIGHGRIHDWFTVADPDGWVLTVNSSHVVGTV